MKSKLFRPIAAPGFRRGFGSIALRKVLALGVGAVGLSGTFAVAQSNWTNGDGNNLWSDPGNWSGGLPQAGYTVQIVGIPSGFQNVQADNVSVGIASLTSDYAYLNLNTSDISITGQLNDFGGGINVYSGSTLSASTATFSGSNPYFPALYNAGTMSFSGGFQLSFGGITNAGVFSANDFSLQQSHNVAAFYNTGAATFTGGFSFVGGTIQATANTFDSDGPAAQINFNISSGGAVVENGILEATNGGGIGGNIGLLTITQGGILTADGLNSAVNLTAGTVMNEFQGQEFGTQPYNWTTISATNFGQLTINATNFTNTYQNVQGGNVSGLAEIQATSNGVLTLNVSGTLTNNAYIEALTNGTINVNAANVNGSGSLEAIGASSLLNLSGATYFGQYAEASAGGVIKVGSLAAPIASFNAGGLLDDNYEYGAGVYNPGTDVTAYVTQFDGLYNGNFDDYVWSRDGATTSLTGSTYTGSTVFAASTYGLYPGSTVTITESTRATGLGDIYASGTPSVGINQVSISAPIITFDAPYIYSNPDGLVFLDASTALTLDDDGTYTSYGYLGPQAEATGGNLILQSPDIQISGTAVKPMELYASDDGLLKINATGPSGLVEITNQGVSSLSTESTISGGSIELDGATAINGVNSYLVSAYQGSIVFNNSNAAGLDSQNAGTLSAYFYGSLIAGGSTFENEAGGLISVSQYGNVYLGYTLPAPGAQPQVSSELLTTTNYGTFNVFGAVTSNGDFVNGGGGTLTIADTGDPTLVGQYSPATLTVTTGDFDNEGNATVTGSSLTVLNGNLINSGTLTITDDLSSSSQAYNSTVLANGGFQNTGTVNVTGSTVSVFGTLTNAGSLTVVADTSGGQSFGNNYPAQPGVLNIYGSLDNTTVGGSTGNLLIEDGGVLSVQSNASITNEQGATLTLLDSTTDFSESTLTNATGAMFTLTGGTLHIGDGGSPAAVAINNTSGATLTVNNDYSAVAGGSSPNVGSLTIYSGNVQNSSSATILVSGSTFSLSGGDFINSTGAKFDVYDDLSQGVLVGPVLPQAYLNQNLTNSSGALVDVLGSTLQVSGTVTNNGGLINVRDDTTGGAVYGNSYPPQFSTLLVPFGDLTNEGSGSITVTQSTLEVDNGTITNQDSANFTVQDDSSLGLSNGATLNAYGPNGLVNTGSANFNVIGSTVNVSNTLTNSGSAIFTVTSDDAAYISSGGTASALTATVNAGQVTNSDSANFKLIGGELITGGFINSGNAVLTLDQTPDGNFSGYVQSYNGFTNGTSQTDAAKVNIMNESSLYVVFGQYFQTGANSKTYVGANSGLSASTVALGNPGDPAGSAGFLGGSGDVFGNVVNNAGTIDPGDPQSLNIFGSLTVGANGELAFHIDGLGGAGVGNDSLNVNGNVQLGGTLDLIIGQGFTPMKGETFDILTVSGGTITGDFTTLEETINGQTFALKGTLDIGSGGITFQPAATPEPASWLALGAGFLGLLSRRRRRK